jgi:Leucine-rich repeat (LRR) protein
MEQEPQIGILVVYDCSNQGLTSINPENFPPNLQYLICRRNSLKRLPPLPDTVLEIHCDSNILEELPNPLPPNLTYLNCISNKLKFLPELPQTLQHLYCDYNYLKRLPNLPDETHLVNIYCSRNNLEELPVLDEAIHLEKLYCSYNSKLEEIPYLPPNIDKVKCKGNLNLTRITNIPSSLRSLVCHNCQLEQLPVIDITTSDLRILRCQNNRLTSLPNLPDRLIALDCSDNFLKSLGMVLPRNLNFLLCANNKLSTLPPFDRLKKLDCVNNPFDLETLERIFEHYYNQFVNHEEITDNDSAFIILMTHYQKLIEQKKNFIGALRKGPLLGRLDPVLFGNVLEYQGAVNTGQRGALEANIVDEQSMSKNVKKRANDESDNPAKRSSTGEKNTEQSANRGGRKTKKRTTKKSKTKRFQKKKRCVTKKK